MKLAHRPAETVQFALIFDFLAVGQFQREEVLFRESERLDLLLWVRRLFRDKEPLPTPGQALFCFVVLFALRWLSLDLGGGLAPVCRVKI